MEVLHRRDEAEVGHPAGVDAGVGVDLVAEAAGVLARGEERAPVFVEGAVDLADPPAEGVGGLLFVFAQAFEAMAELVAGLVQGCVGGRVLDPGLDQLGGGHPREKAGEVAKGGDLVGQLDLELREVLDLLEGDLAGVADLEVVLEVIDDQRRPPTGALLRADDVAVDVVADVEDLVGVDPHRPL